VEYSGNPGKKFDWATIHSLNGRPSAEYDGLTMANAFAALDKAFGIAG
jgi:hypothetical protein